MNKEASNRVETCRQYDSRVLDLSSLHLSVLHAETGQLTQLTTFYLRWNQLSVLPAEIGQLVNLKTLDLCHNELGTLPAEIGQLVNLTELYLDDNELTALPKETRQLVNLRTLSLRRNRFTAEALKHAFYFLTQLRVLSVDDDATGDLPEGSTVRFFNYSIYHGFKERVAAQKIAVYWAEHYEVVIPPWKDDNGKTCRMNRDVASVVGEFLFPGTQRRMQRGELRTIRAQKILKRRAEDEKARESGHGNTKKRVE